MVLGPRRVLRCRMICKGATECFGQEKASAAHLAQVNAMRRHLHRVKLCASG